MPDTPQCLFPGCVLPRGHRSPFHEPSGVLPLTLRNLIARLLRREPHDA